MSDLGLVAALSLCGYFLGAVPFGVVISKAMGLPDPRTVGSKNVGFTNVLRVSGKTAGILTLIGDMGKGWVMGFIATQLLQDEWAILFVALAPFLGHLFSPFLGIQRRQGCRDRTRLSPRSCAVDWIVASTSVDRSCGPMALLLRRRADCVRTLSHPCCISSAYGSLCFVLCADDCAYCDQAQGEHRTVVEGDGE